MSENINLRPISELLEVESVSDGDKLLLKSNGEAKLIDPSKVGGSGGGLPSGGEPHQMLVTDNEGNTVWDDRSHWTEVTVAEIMSEREVSPSPPLGTYSTIERLNLIIGEEYTITWNGVDYKCFAKQSDFLGAETILCGNERLTANSGEDTGEPFAVMEFVENDPLGMGINVGIYFAEETAATISIKGLATVVHKIPAQYLPHSKNSYIENGGAIGSLRTTGAYHEDENYVMSEYAFAIGNITKASGWASSAIGDATEAASESQHVQGAYNIPDYDRKYLHIVGNGEYGARSNAHTLDWNGNAWYAGTVEGTAMIVKSTTTGSTKRFKITVDDSGTLSAVELTE